MTRLTVNAIVRRLLHVAHSIGEQGFVHLVHVVRHSLQHVCTSALPVCTSRRIAPQLAGFAVTNGCTSGRLALLDQLMLPLAARMQPNT